MNILKVSQKWSGFIAKICLLTLLLAFLNFPVNALASGALTSVKDTLDNSRPGVATTISGTITAGDTIINVTSTAGINTNDSVFIKDGGTTETRVVSSVLTSTKLLLTAGTVNGYSTSGSVYLKQLAKHTITFTTHSAVSSGKFIIYIPADAAPTDSLPAANGYDFNSITTSTSTDFTLTGFTATSVSTSTANSNLVFTIPFTGSVPTTTAISITIGGTNKLISPTKTASAGTADTYTVEVDETDGSANVIDTTSVKVGTIEAVAVSATVTPSLTFTINAVNSNVSVAGTTTDATSTATTAPLGNLTPVTNRNVAQYIHIDTNSAGGYIVTVQSDGSLRKSDGTKVTDYSTTAADNNAVNGFGYSLMDKTNTPSSFHYNDSGTFFSKGFSSSSPVTIMSNGAAASGDESYIIYHARVSNTQAQGTYSDLVTVIATATY